MLHTASPGAAVPNLLWLVIPKSEAVSNQETFNLKDFPGPKAVKQFNMSHENI